MKDIKVKVVEIKGRCPVYKVGDEFYLKEGYKLVSKIPLCMHSLSSLMPYYVAMAKEVEVKDLNLNSNKTSNSIYLQCLDPRKYTNGGTVVFEVRV
jgi:uncharacterized repeat protein (TIGR04076 family)